MTTQIRVVADDYGLSASVNRGVEELAHARCIQGVSIMAHRDAELSTLDVLRAAPVELGAHLVFVEERPRTDSAMWRHFGGVFPTTYRALFLAVLRYPELLCVLVAEAEAQISELRARGVELRFVNSHQHTHLFLPLWRALAPLFRREGLAVRVARSIRLSPPKQLFVEASSSLSSALWPVHAGRHWTPVGIDAAGRFDAAAARSWGARLSAPSRYRGPVEVVIHPGCEDEDLRLRYGHWGYHWEQERRLFASGEGQALLGIAGDESAGRGRV